MFKPDKYYRGCPKLGRGLPVEIEFGRQHIQIENDWFLDELIDAESPEDHYISIIDGQPEQFLSIGDIDILPFDFDKLTTDVLSKEEYEIFYAHYVEDKSFRVLGRERNCYYTKVFTIYKRALDKLRKAILDMNEIES